MSTIDLDSTPIDKESSVDMTSELSVAEQWIEAMLKAGAVDPRTGEPSNSRLAEMSGTGTTTISNMRSGASKTSPATIQKVADALRINVKKVSQWVGQAREVSTPYTPPPEADLLDSRERKLVNDMIQALAKNKKFTEAAQRMGDRISTVNPGRTDIAWAEPSGPGDSTPQRDDKPVDLSSRRKGPKPDRDVEQHGARKGETEERRRRRTTKQPEDVPDPDGPEDGA